MWEGCEEVGGGAKMWEGCEEVGGCVKRWEGWEEVGGVGGGGRGVKRSEGV